MDVISQGARSKLMSKIRSKDTKPEKKIRSLLHKLGYRFRLHQKALPGTPDIVLARHRKIVLVHGCFWHGHGCEIASLPKSNQQYWHPKIQKNRDRDRTTTEKLEKLGWAILEIWECETRKPAELEEKISAFMRQHPPTPDKLRHHT